jgi:hypothetical protein
MACLCQFYSMVVMTLYSKLPFVEFSHPKLGSDRVAVQRVLQWKFRSDTALALSVLFPGCPEQNSGSSATR